MLSFTRQTLLSSAFQLRAPVYRQCLLMSQFNMRLFSTDYKQSQDNPILPGPGDFQKSTISPPKDETMKFSSFLRNEKTYTIPKQSQPTEVAERFLPKPEYTQIKFDPNIRQRPMEMPNHLLYRYMYGIVPRKSPESAYVAVHHAG